MPEAYEYFTMVAHCKDLVVGMNIQQISALGEQFDKAGPQEKHMELIRKMRKRTKEKSCIVTDLICNGKEIMLITTTMRVKIGFGQGAYIHFLEDDKELENEPFASDGFVAFRGFKNGNKCALVIVDVRTTRHQVNLYLDQDWNTTGRSPSVLSEEFSHHFLSKLQDKKCIEILKEHSLAYVLFSEKWFYGLGEYSVSEILCRLNSAFGVAPWDRAWDCILNIPKFLESFIDAPKVMLEEQKLYWKHYSPAKFGSKQQLARAEFRLNFLQVYRKRKNKGKSVASFTFKGAKGWKSIYTYCLWDTGDIPIGLVSKGKKNEISDETGEATLNVVEVEEKWYRYQGLILSHKGLGVGLHDWHFVSVAEETGLCEPKQRPLELSSASVPKRKKTSKQEERMEMFKEKRKQEIAADREAKKKYSEGLLYSSTKSVYFAARFFLQTMSKV